jgi:hypothetical protein
MSEMIARLHIIRIEPQRCLIGLDRFIRATALEMNIPQQRKRRRELRINGDGALEGRSRLIQPAEQETRLSQAQLNLRRPRLKGRRLGRMQQRLLAPSGFEQRGDERQSIVRHRGPRENGPGHEVVPAAASPRCKRTTPSRCSASGCPGSRSITC